MNILLFGGFLGSGKTSIILQAAKYLVPRIEETGSGHTGDDENPSLIIIENEVGGAGIDDKILKDEGLNVRELFAGCICCTLNAELNLCLEEIQEEFSPKWVIIETTGMAYPDRISESIKKYGEGIESIATIVVADAERWEELVLAFPGLIKGQVAHGDVIFLNKIESIEAEYAAVVTDKVKELNPEALFFAVSAHQEIDVQIWDKVVFGK
ncbi:putative GTPase, G3E family [Desulfosporosinus orientis DSM 765]|uniref:Putative GTPase, G3E family n=1 Tax=Desulfosporosinus orientis (strain ATCC 19365 / DSM 765 / NCIMB 8382 / VKM B-1628 / Singapore I) TaxID=768706 RepID=G7W5U1_DESOD|nr:GTP-binding protein [Desulfosporosinus orientis]AET67029.1 putative GTPase, G3E family [Desulfosporosinus orientis DSM 765]